MMTQTVKIRVESHYVKGNFMSTPITQSNFNKILTGVINGASRGRDVLQALLVFGLEHFRDTGDTVYLTRCLTACIGVQSLPTKTMKAFIQAHANVTWTKASDSTMVFKKEGKEVTVKPVSTLWYQHNASHQAQPDMDVMAQVASFLTRIETKMKEGKIKQGQEALAAQLRDALSSIKNQPKQVVQAQG